MKRTWKTTLTSTGSTPGEALANLMEDSLADHLRTAIYINPQYPPIIESIQQGGDGRVIGWEASVTVIREGEIE